MKSCPNPYVGERQYLSNFWLEFINNAMEDKYKQEHSQSHKMFQIGIIIFNISHCAFKYSELDSDFKIINWILILSLLFSLISLLLVNNHNKKIHILTLGLSSLYFYCTNFIDLDGFYIVISSAIHMQASNLLILHSWRLHVYRDITTLLGTEITCLLFGHSQLQYLVINLQFLILLPFVYIICAYFERTQRQSWVWLDSYKRSNKNLEKIIEDLPLPIFLITSELDVVLQSYLGFKLLKVLKPEENMKKIKIQSFINEQQQAELMEMIKICNDDQNSSISQFSFPLNEQNLDFHVILSQSFWKSKKAYLLTFQDSAIFKLPQSQEKVEEIQQQQQIEQNQIENQEKQQIQQQLEICQQELVEKSHKIDQLEKHIKEEENKKLVKNQSQIIEQKKQKLQYQQNIGEINLSCSAEKENKEKNGFNSDIEEIKESGSKMASINKYQPSFSHISPINKKEDSHIKKQQESQISTDEKTNGVIDMEEEIKNHISYLEKGVVKTILNVIKSIHKTGGKKVNITFPSLNSPRVNGSQSSNISPNPPSQITSSGIDVLKKNKSQFNQFMTPSTNNRKLNNVPRFPYLSKFKKEDGNPSIKINSPGEKSSHKDFNFQEELKESLIPKAQKKKSSLTVQQNFDLEEYKFPQPLSSNNISKQEFFNSNFVFPNNKGNIGPSFLKKMMENDQSQFNLNNQQMLQQPITKENQEEQINQQKPINNIPQSSAQQSQTQPQQENKQNSLKEEPVQNQNTIEVKNTSPKLHLNVNFKDEIQTSVEQQENQNQIINQNKDQVQEISDQIQQKNQHQQEQQVPQIEPPQIENKVTIKKPTQKIQQEPLQLLLVDDNSTVCTQYCYMKLEQKTKRDFCRNGQEGLNKYKQLLEKDNIYLFILMDIQMPVMDGIAATQEIRKIEQEQNVRKTYIIGMHNDVDDSNQAKYLKSGFDEIIEKPFNFLQISEFIQKRLLEDKEYNKQFQ